MRKRKNPYRVNKESSIEEQDRHKVWEQGYKAGRKDEREINGWKPCLPLGSSD